MHNPTAQDVCGKYGVAVACSLGGNNPHQPSMDVGRRELAAQQDVTSTAEKKDRTEGRSEAMRHVFEDEQDGGTERPQRGSIKGRIHRWSISWRSCGRC